ncbi:MAG: PRC-barrel domain-containing protein [Verrucomicrobiota bacterium]
MKRKLQIIISASAVSVLAFSALAQDPPIPKAAGPNYAHDGISRAQRENRLNDAAKSSDIIGMTVNNYQDEKLGKVEDLSVDVESGRIVQVILSTGGFIGIGDTLTAVPPGALNRDITHNVLQLDADKEKLRGAPKFEMSQWAEHSDSNHLSAVYHLYGQEFGGRFIQREEAVEDGQRNADGSPSTISTRKADGTWDKNHISSQSQFMIPVSRLIHVQKASKLMGMPVKNLQNEALGKVENLLVDLPSGRVVAVIVSSGGFLGMADELSAVPPVALRFTAYRDTLQLDVSKETLNNAPHFKANQWPDLGQPGYANGVYRAYRVEPYFSTKLTGEIADRIARAENVNNQLEVKLTTSSNN